MASGSSLAKLALIGLLTAPATGPERAVPHGEWHFPLLEGFGAMQRWSLTLAADRVVMTNRCSFAGRTAEARASARARVGDGAIAVLEARSEVVVLQPGRVECRVALDRGELRYRLDGDRLEVTDPVSGESAILTRLAR